MPAVYASEMLYFFSVLSIPLEPDAITFRTLIKATFSFSCYVGKHKNFIKELKFYSYRPTHVVVSIYFKVYLHKEFRFCFQAISSFHVALAEECENEAFGELLENFC